MWNTIQAWKQLIESMDVTGIQAILVCTTGERWSQ